VTDLLRELSTDPIHLEKVESRNCGPKTEPVLFAKTGPGVVKGVWMAVTGGNNPVLDGRLRVYYDGLSTPSVDVDLGTLFAIHWGGGSTNGSLSTPHTAVGINQQLMETSFLLGYPMPYGPGGIKICYYNPGTSQNAFLFSQVYWAATATDTANGQRLRSVGVRVLDQLATRQPGDVVTAANIAGGSGTVVHLSYVGGVDAASITPGSSNNDSWMERNISATVDGEPSPTFVATGTEDFFDSGWYFNGWKDYATSRHSYVATDKPSYQPHCVGMATDLWSKFGGIPFAKSIVLRIETEAACTTGDRYAYAVLYYQT